MPLRTPMKNHRLIIVGKAPCVVPASPNLAIASTSETRRYERWAALGIAAATLAISVILSNAPGAAGAATDRRRDGATAPWEKTAGPPGIQTNVIFEANNTVYAGTETQGVYKSTDNGLTWVPANGGIERA